MIAFQRRLQVLQTSRLKLSVPMYNIVQENVLTAVKWIAVDDIVDVRNQRVSVNSRTVVIVVGPVEQLPGRVVGHSGGVGRGAEGQKLSRSATTCAHLVDVSHMLIHYDEKIAGVPQRPCQNIKMQLSQQIGPT